MEDQMQGWHPDPWERHRLRYHDGHRWTRSVVDDGDVFEDPTPATNPPGDVDGHTTAGAKRYHAFISYSHGEDGDIAAALQRGLTRLAKPWRQRRALEVFRDETSLAANPSLWTTLTGALERSGWLVVLASPTSAASPWVGKEIDHWLQSRGAGRILIAHTGGRLRWDESAGAFTADSDALHPVLHNAFAEEPLYVDLTWAKDPRADLSLRDPRFRRQVAELAAPMHGIDKDELESDDIAMQRRVRRLTRAAVVTLVALTFSSAAAGMLAASERREAVTQRDRATSEARTALSQSLAARADTSDAERPDRRLLIAAAADRLESTPASRRALVGALLDVDEIRVLLPDHAGAVIDVHATPDGSRIATVDAAGQLRVWDDAGALVLGPLETGATFARLSSDGTWVVTLDRAGLARWIDLDSGREHSAELTSGDEQVAIGCDAWGCHPLAALSPDGTLALGVDIDVAGEQWAVRFADRDGAPSDVATTSPVTAIAWSGHGTLVVGDFVGLQTWDGERGPHSEDYGHEFHRFSGVAPGGLAIGGPFFEHGNGEVVAFAGPDEMGDPTYLWVSTIDGEGDWATPDITRLLSPTEATNAAQAQGISDHIASVAVTEGRVVVGSDARQGGAFRTSMVEVTGSRLDQRHLLGSDVPPRAITRMVPVGDRAVAVAGFDEVVRVVGPGSSLTSVSSTGPETLGDLADMLDGMIDDELPSPGSGLPPMPGRLEREEAVDALDDLGDDLDPFDGVAHPDGRVLVGLFADLEAILDSSTAGGMTRGEFRGLDGELRIFDGDRDVTPDRLRNDRFTAVALDSGGDEILVGTSEGRIDTVDPHTGEVLQSTRVSRSPVLSLELSADGLWLLATSLEELNLLAADDLGVAATLVTTTTRTGALYHAPALDHLVAGFTDEGSVAFSWVGPPTGIDHENTTGPFGNPPVADLDDRADSLPGIHHDIFAMDDSAPVVELRLDNLAERACSLVNREITPAEWDRWVGGIDQEPVCPGGLEPAAPPEVFLDPDEGSERYAVLADVTVPGGDPGGGRDDSDPDDLSDDGDGSATSRWHSSVEEAIAGHFRATSTSTETYLGSCFGEDSDSSPLATLTEGTYCRIMSSGYEEIPGDEVAALLVTESSLLAYRVVADAVSGSGCTVGGERCPAADLRWRVEDDWHSHDGPPPDWAANVAAMFDLRGGGLGSPSGGDTGGIMGDDYNVFVPHDD
jgi:hypothetical protein